MSSRRHYYYDDLEDELRSTSDRPVRRPTYGGNSNSKDYPNYASSYNYGGGIGSARRQ